MPLRKIPRGIPEGELIQVSDSRWNVLWWLTYIGIDYDVGRLPTANFQFNHHQIVTRGSYPIERLPDALDVNFALEDYSSEVKSTPLHKQRRGKRTALVYLDPRNSFGRKGTGSI